MLEKFKFIFDGLEDAYGLQYPAAKANGQGKVKGAVKIVRDPVTNELWENHLKGTEPGLGIIRGGVLILMIILLIINLSLK